MICGVSGLRAVIPGGSVLYNDLNIAISDDLRGKLLCIQGKSGSGKTSLLNFLVFGVNEKKNQTINKVHYSCDSFIKGSRDIGYLSNDISLFSQLTVFEFLHYRSCLIDDFNRTYKRTTYLKNDDNRASKQIHRLLVELELDHLAHRIIGGQPHGDPGLSGGERQKVAIISELLTSPDLLVMDEPTTGLDSFTTIKLIRLLKNIVKKRDMVILASLHHLSESVLKQDLIDFLITIKDGVMDNISPEYPMTNDGITPVCKKDLRMKLKPIGFIPFSKRHLKIRWRSINNWWTWIGRLSVAFLANVCYWNSMNLNDRINFYDHSGLLFMLLMHFQYEVLYMCQVNLSEERQLYSYELARGIISPFTLTGGRLYGELLLNTLNVIPLVITVNYSAVAFQQLLVFNWLKIFYYIIFSTVMSSMWKSVGMWITDFRHMTYIGDLYVNISMQACGYWVALTALGPESEWIKYVSVISQIYNGLTNITLKDNIYLDGEEEVTGQQILIDRGITTPIWLNFIIIMALFVLFEVVAYTGAIYGRAYRHR